MVYEPWFIVSVENGKDIFRILLFHLKFILKKFTKFGSRSGKAAFSVIGCAPLTNTQFLHSSIAAIKDVDLSSDLVRSRCSSEGGNMVFEDY